MSLPAKSRYSISEAASYITSALSESVTTGQVLDWGAQELYKLYLSIGHATVRQGEKVSHINDCLVEIRPTAEQAAQLSRGAKITIVDCWREGDKYEFVRSRAGEYGGGHTRNTLYVAIAAVAVAGPELQSFIARIRTATVEAPPPEEPAPATPRVWDEHTRRKLLAEYNAPGATHDKLAAQYKCSRQFIGQKLKEAREEASPKKATSFDAIIGGSRKK